MTLEQMPDADDQAPESASQAEAQTEPVPVTPTERMYAQSEFDYHMGRARKSFETQAARRQEAAIAAVRAEYEQQGDPVAVDPNDPYAHFDPNVAATLRAVLRAEFDARVAPFKQQQEDLKFRSEEAEVRAKYPDYADQTRLDVLEFAVRNQIPRLEMAYRAWKFGTMPSREKIERESIGAYVKRKVKQVSSTPSVEKGGGGAPSGKQKFRSREEMDEALIAALDAADS